LVLAAGKHVCCTCPRASLNRLNKTNVNTQLSFGLLVCARNLFDRLCEWNRCRTLQHQSLRVQHFLSNGHHSRWIGFVVCKSCPDWHPVGNGRLLFCGVHALVVQHMLHQLPRRIFRKWDRMRKGCVSAIVRRPYVFWAVCHSEQRQMRGERMANLCVFSHSRNFHHSARVDCDIHHQAISHSIIRAPLHVSSSSAHVR
jgi:hypothetical protein